MCICMHACTSACMSVPKRTHAHAHIQRDTNMHVCTQTPKRTFRSSAPRPGQRKQSTDHQSLRHPRPRTSGAPAPFSRVVRVFSKSCRSLYLLRRVRQKKKTPPPLFPLIPVCTHTRLHTYTYARAHTHTPQSLSLSYTRTQRRNGRDSKGAVLGDRSRRRALEHVHVGRPSLSARTPPTPGLARRKGSLDGGHVPRTAGLAGARAGGG